MYVIICVILTTAVVVLSSKANDPELNCLVCQRLADEIEAEIEKVDPHKKVDLGTFRINPDGTQKSSKVPYARSVMHLGELLETICDNFKDYAKATYKDNGRRTLLRLIGHDGNMNPDFSKVDITPDSELNTRLKFYCENIVEDHEDEIYSVFKIQRTDPSENFCVEETSICGAVAKEEL